MKLVWGLYRLGIPGCGEEDTSDSGYWLYGGEDTRCADPGAAVVVMIY